jgi:hypothetical protein
MGLRQTKGHFEASQRLAEKLDSLLREKIFSAQHQ